MYIGNFVQVCVTTYFHLAVEVVKSMGFLGKHVHVLIRVSNYLQLVQDVAEVVFLLLLPSLFLLLSNWPSWFSVFSPVFSLFPLLLFGLDFLLLKYFLYFG